MKFFTQVPIKQYTQKLDYQSEVVLIGSCFAEHMGNHFKYFKFKSTTNPFGIIFNPISIKKLLFRATDKQYFTREDLFEYNDLWHCFEVHSDFSRTEAEVILTALNDQMTLTHQKLQSATHLIVTLGTAWVYEHNQTSQIVANCHKVPQIHFRKKLLSVEEISQSLDEIAERFKDSQIIFTVSPVRHIKDGFTENTLSKSHLIAALHATLQKQPNCNYFPSYEIMMDELRDYRYYNPDMLHPNSVAVSYIWEQFRSHYMDPNCYKIMETIDSVQKGLAHRPFNPNTAQHQRFLENIQKKIAQLGDIWFD